MGKKKQRFSRTKKLAKTITSGGGKRSKKMRQLFVPQGTPSPLPQAGPRRRPR